MDGQQGKDSRDILHHYGGGGLKVVESHWSKKASNPHRVAGRDTFIQQYQEYIVCAKILDRKPTQTPWQRTANGAHDGNISFREKHLRTTSYYQRYVFWFLYLARRVQ